MKETNPMIVALLDEAVRLRDAGNLAAAIKRLNEALAMNPQRRSGILGVLGHLYFKQKDFERSSDCLREVVELSPNSELGSIQLFHTLWDMGKEWEAFAEAKRFLSLHDSQAYFSMIEEMRDAYIDAGIVVPPSKSWREGN